MSSKQWKPVERIGTPAISLRQEVSPTAISVRFKVTAKHGDEWEKLFLADLTQRGFRVSFDSFIMGTMGGYAHIDEADLEKLINAVDAAIESANQYYSTTVIPKRQADNDARAQDADAARERKAELERRAAQFSKPDAPVRGMK